MKRLFTLFLLLQTLSFSLSGQTECDQNIPIQTRDGVDMLPQYYRTRNTLFSEEYIRSYSLDSILSGNYKTRNDIAFHLTRLGRHDEALDILLDLYKQYPQEYNIMCNLATAYALNDMPDSAMSILQKTDTVSSDGHVGGRWFQLKVLEAKLQIQKDSSWLHSHNVITLGITQPFDKRTEQYRINVDNINTIKDQVREYIQFTPTPDLLLANALKELGQAMATEYSLQQAHMIYYIAMQYDPADTYDLYIKLGEVTRSLQRCGIEVPGDEMISRYFPPLDSTPPIIYEACTYSSAVAQIKQIIKLQKEELRKSKMSYFIWVGIAVVAVLGLGLFFYIRKRG